ncbi:terpene synthase family protein [Streptomyces sp. NPDC000405]|uniref:terpene synthase family protein n=1 Tax=Streptomyces sp. NPDC000405 TaxID=3161033 RepID=UPI00398D0A38
MTSTDHQGPTAPGQSDTGEELVIPRLTYPWPTIDSPLADALDEETFRWYDEDYADIFPDPADRERYRKQLLSRVTPYMFPTANDIDRLRPAARWMNHITLMDDFFDLTPAKEIAPLRNRIYQVMTGRDDPRPGELGLLRQLAAAREEFRRYVPQFWIDRMALSHWQYIHYGLMEEVAFRRQGIYPSIHRCRMIRMHSIGQRPFADQIEPVTGVLLPGDVFNHPVVQRLRDLQACVIALQNDISSLHKELALGQNEVVSQILSVRHHRQVSLQQAVDEVVAMHNRDVEEIWSLQQCIPDFGPHQAAVENYVQHLGIQIAGLQNWYDQIGRQFRYGYGGFVIPQYGRKEIKIKTKMAYVGPDGTPYEPPRIYGYGREERSAGAIDDALRYANDNGTPWQGQEKAD